MKVKIVIPPISLILAFLLLSCALQNKSIPLGTWQHDQSQVAAEGMVFVKAELGTLPPSRFRQAFILKQDGVCEFNELAPSDAHEFSKGKFRLKNGMLIIENGGSDQKFKFELVKLEADRIVMKKL